MDQNSTNNSNTGMNVIVGIIAIVAIFAIVWFVMQSINQSQQIEQPTTDEPLDVNVEIEGDTNPGS